MNDVVIKKHTDVRIGECWNICKDGKYLYSVLRGEDGLSYDEVLALVNADSLTPSAE